MVEEFNKQYHQHQRSSIINATNIKVLKGIHALDQIPISFLLQLKLAGDLEGIPKVKILGQGQQMEA